MVHDFSIDTQVDPLVNSPIQSDADNTAFEPPADLCNQCGKCCRMATPGIVESRLHELANNGHTEAQAFLDVFMPYPSVEAARAVMPDHVAKVEQLLQQDNHTYKDALTFYHCRHIQPDNRCGIYADRPLFCRQTPRNGWMVMPPGCGFEGWQFTQREQQVWDIRKLKEHLQFLEALSPDGIHHPLRPTEPLQPLRDAVAERVSMWARFGAEDW
jgi:Fe-S-cluster containining protein